MCKAYWTGVGMLVAFNALVWLTIANEVLRRADGPHSASRTELENRHREAVSRELRAAWDEWNYHETLRLEATEMTWLIRDTAQQGLVIERDYGAIGMN